MESTLVVLALRGEHMKFFFKVFESFLDRLLTAISLFISRLERA